MLSDTRALARIQEQSEFLSDPMRWQRARAGLRMLTDRDAIERARIRAGEIQEQLAVLRQAARGVDDAALLAALGSSDAPDASVASDRLQSEVQAWEQTLDQLEALDPEFLEPADLDEGTWVDALPTLTQLRLLSQVVALLNAILLAAAVMGVSALPLPVLAAAEALIRLSDLLWEKLRESDQA